MEAEERPTKKRKLSPEIESPAVFGGATSQIEISSTHPAAEDENPISDQHRNPDAPNGNHERNQDSAISLPAPEEISPLAATITATNGKPMSKSQQKKLRKNLEWEAKRDERKIIRKEKEKAKRERKREEKQKLAENGIEIQPAANETRSKSIQLPVTFLIDCDFDDLMRDGERKSLATQITRSYADNRRSPFRAHLAVCSFTGKLRERFDNVLSHYTGWKGVRFLDCDFVEAAAKAREWMADVKHGGQLAGSFSKLQTDEGEIPESLKDQGEIVYLTSEADEDLTELKPYSTYIIGGLVDKNREKGICYKRARQRGIRTAKLPIGEFMEMQSRKVLATNHVNEIMLKWLECGDWGEAFMTAIPKRKGGMLKGADGEDDDRDDEGAELENGMKGGLHDEVR